MKQVQPATDRTDPQVSSRLLTVSACAGPNFEHQPISTVLCFFIFRMAEFRFTLETETTANGEVQLINRGLAGTGLQTYLGQETNESILTEECVCDSGVYAGSPKARVEIILK
jgi:hypothetical protein